MCDSNGHSYPNECVFNHFAQCAGIKPGECRTPPVGRKISVFGRLKFSPEIDAFRITKNSCLRVIVEEDVVCLSSNFYMCRPPILGAVAINEPTFNADKTMSYSVDFTQTSSPRIRLRAYLNIGWCGNDKETMRPSDYLTKSEYVIEETSAAMYEKDMQLDVYIPTSGGLFADTLKSPREGGGGRGLISLTCIVILS